MADFAITTALKMTDGVSPVFSAMGASSNRYFSLQNRHLQKANSDWTRVINTAKGFFTGQLMVQGFNSIRNGIAGITREWVSFDDASRFAASKFQEVQESSVSFERALASTKRTAMEVGAATMFTAGQSSQAMEILASQGVRLEDANTNTMMAIAKLATVARTDLPTATRILTGSMAAWGVGFDKIGMMSDQMVKSFTTSKMSIEDLGESTKKAGMLFRSAGQDVVTFNALMAAMGESNILAEEAGVRGRSILTGLTDIKSLKGFRKFGVDIGVDGDFRNIIDIFADVKKELAGMGTLQQQVALSNVLGFEKRDIAVVQQLIEMTGGRLEEYRDKAAAYNNATQRQFALVSGSIAQRWKILESAITSKVFTGMETAQSTLAQLITDVINFVDSFDMTKINAFIDANLPGVIGLVKAGFDAAKPSISDVVKLTAAMVGPMTLILEKGAPLIDFYIKWRFAMMGATVVGNILAISQSAFAKQLIYNIGFMKLYAAEMGVLKAVQWAATAAQNALNVAMAANPIGIIVVAVAALGVAVWTVYQNWGKILSVITLVWSKVKNFFLAVSPFLALWVDLTLTIWNNWDNIKKAFSDGGIVSGLKMIGKMFAHAFLLPLNLTLTALNKLGILSDDVFHSWQRMHGGLLPSGPVVVGVKYQELPFESAPGFEGTNVKTREGGGLDLVPDYGFDFSGASAPNRSEVMSQRNQSVDVTTRIDNRTQFQAETTVTGDTGGVNGLGAN